MLAKPSALGARSSGQSTTGGLVDERRSERPLALAGIVAVVLLAVSALTPGSPPEPDDPAAKIAKFLVEKSDQIRWAGFIAALGSIVLLAWLGAVWRMLRR